MLMSKLRKFIKMPKIVKDISGALKRERKRNRKEMVFGLKRDTLVLTAR